METNAQVSFTLVQCSLIHFPSSQSKLYTNSCSLIYKVALCNGATFPQNFFSYVQALDKSTTNPFPFTREETDTKTLKWFERRFQKHASENEELDKEAFANAINDNQVHQPFLNPALFYPFTILSISSNILILQLHLEFSIFGQH